MRTTDLINYRIYQHQEPDPGSNPPTGDPAPADPPADPPPADPPSDPPADPPADWRKDLAGDNEDYAKRLERYTDQGAFVESAMQAHDKIRAGEVSTGMPENATEEQVNSFREANNIPLDGKYKLSLEPGIELDARDLQVVDGVMKVAHEANVPTATLNAMVSASYLGRNQIIEEMQTQDTLDAQTFETQSKELWGGDREENMTRLSNLMNGLDEESRGQLLHGRLDNGKAFGSSLEIANWLVGLDRQIHPMRQMPGGGENTTGGAQSIIDESKLMMKDDSKAWHKDHAAQERYQDALRFMERHNQGTT